MTGLVSSIPQDNLAYVPAEALAATAEALIRAGQSERAMSLLEVTTTDDVAARARLLLLAARAAVDADYRTGTDLAATRLSASAEAVAAVAAVRPELRWDLAFAELNHAYLSAIFEGSSPSFGPAGRDPEQISSLRDGAARLYDDSPDTGRRGWASMLQGWVADNVAGEREAAPARYGEALDCAGAVGDDYLAFEALRHLGDHSHDDGDHEGARRRWERSTEHAAAAGSVPGTLAQQLLVAVLHRDSGNEAGARALAREIERWAGAIGASRLREQAHAFGEGVDPTAPPPDVDD